MMELRVPLQCGGLWEGDRRVLAVPHAGRLIGEGEETVAGCSFGGTSPDLLIQGPSFWATPPPHSRAPRSGQLSYS